MFQETRRSRHCSWWLPHTHKTPSKWPRVASEKSSTPLLHLLLILPINWYTQKCDQLPFLWLWVISQRLFFCRFGDAKKFQAELDSATHRVQVISIKLINLRDVIDAEYIRNWKIISTVELCESTHSEIYYTPQSNYAKMYQLLVSYDRNSLCHY